MSRASSYSRPSCYLLLLLALRVGLIALLACTLGMLLSTLRMLHALCVIALAVLLSGGTVRFCRVFVEFGGFVVIAVRHLRFLKFNSQRETICQTLSRSQTSRNGVGCALFHLEPRGISSHKLRMAPNGLDFSAVMAIGGRHQSKCTGEKAARRPVSTP
jgi:hypothetical protein